MEELNEDITCAATISCELTNGILPCMRGTCCRPSNCLNAIMSSAFREMMNFLGIGLGRRIGFVAAWLCNRPKRFDLESCACV